MADTSAFTWRVRVYWEDTDAGGVVYHANYLRFMERARSEWLRALGVDQGELRARTGLALMVRDMQLDFHAPAALDDELIVRTRPLQLRAASMVFAQEVARTAAPQLLLVQARVRIACVNVARMRAAPLPDALLARMRTA